MKLVIGILVVVVALYWVIRNIVGIVSAIRTSRAAKKKIKEENNDGVGTD